MRLKNRRKLSRRILNTLPEGLRYKLLRRHVPVCGALSPQLEIKIADSEPELAVAYRLLHDSYVSSGFMQPHPTGMRVLLQHMLPQTSTIVAKWEGKVVGTLSLIRDNPFGLPMENLFDLSSRRFGGRRLAEVSSLAVDPGFRGKATEVLFPLFRYIYHYALSCFGTHEFVIAVSPSIVDLYAAFLLFRKLEARPKPYDFVNGVPAMGLYLDFEGLVERWRQAFSHCPEHVSWFTQVPDTPGNALPARDFYVSSDPILTPRLLEHFFLKRAGLGRGLSAEQIWTLSNEWRDPCYQEVFSRIPEICQLHQQRELRIDVQMPVRMGGQAGAEMRGEILNISSRGLQLRSAGKLARNQFLELQVEVSPSGSIRLRTRVAWISSGGVYGLEILSPSFEWARMIRSLHKRLERLGGETAFLKQG